MDRGSRAGSSGGRQSRDQRDSSRDNSDRFRTTYRDRNREYSFRESEVQTLIEFGKFRVVPADDPARLWHHLSPAWIANNNWRDASVRVLAPLEGGVLFEQARVQGPILEGEGTNCYCGFRIQLGPASPEGAINSLKAQWDALPKR